MFQPHRPRPVYVLIGSEYEVSWSEALTGWITYYHLSLAKEVRAEEAVQTMNLAAGENDLFKIYQ
jgi:hypothetical protein